MLVLEKIGSYFVIWKILDTISRIKFTRNIAEFIKYSIHFNLKNCTSAKSAIRNVTKRIAHAQITHYDPIFYVKIVSSKSVDADITIAIYSLAPSIYNVQYICRSVEIRIGEQEFRNCHAYVFRLENRKRNSFQTFLAYVLEQKLRYNAPMVRFVTSIFRKVNVNETMKWKLSRFERRFFFVLAGRYSSVSYGQRPWGQCDDDDDDGWYFFSVYCPNVWFRVWVLSSFIVFHLNGGRMHRKVFISK